MSIETRTEYQLNYQRHGKELDIRPCHSLAKNFSFRENEEEEALLANAMAHVAAKNGLTTNDLMHIFPLVLRMLKSETDWAK